MWTWTCPAEKPNPYGEFHTYSAARFFLDVHVKGLKSMYIKPCKLEHEIFDNGYPCSMIGCELKYVPFKPFYK